VSQRSIKACQEGLKENWYSSEGGIGIILRKRSGVPNPRSPSKSHQNQRERGATVKGIEGQLGGLSRLRGKEKRE